MTHLFEDKVSINVSRICLYQQYVGERKSNNIAKLLGSNARERSHIMSVKSIGRLRNAINTLVYTAKWKTVWNSANNSHFRYKINFITLTLPSTQIHSDKEITQKCLSKFLENWAKRRSGLLYLWKAEIQDNGNIHYHITSNAFYHLKKLRTDWNRIVNLLGYVDRCKYENPNSTDVHSVKSIKNIASYIVKYCTKKEVYTRVLARYHKMFKERLASNNDLVFELPKRYLELLKRQVKGVKWSASKVLLKSGLSLDAWDITIKQDMSIMLHNAIYSKFQKFDHCSLLYLSKPLEKGIKLSDFKQINKRYLELLEPIIKKQKEVVVKEIV